MFLAVYIYVVAIRIEAPQQPVFFSHKIHAGQNQIPCQYCHSYVTKSPMAGMPSIQKCMGCHLIIAGQDADYYFGKKAINIRGEIEKLREYWEKSQEKGVLDGEEYSKDFHYLGQKESIPWVRVYYLPEFVHFSHKRHVLRGFGCKTCHGEVEKMDIVYRVQKLEMGWCIGCHEENARDKKELTQLKDCLTCHY